MPSFNPANPPTSLPLSDASVSDWLKSNDAHLIQGPGRPCSGLSDHAPLSPQSSTASSGSGSDTHVDDVPHQPIRNTFMEEGSGMRGELPLSVLGRNFREDILKYLPCFCLKVGFDISCKETFCMKCQSPISLLSTEATQRVVKCLATSVSSL